MIMINRKNAIERATFLTQTSSLNAATIAVCTNPINHMGDQRDFMGNAILFSRQTPLPQH